MAENKKSFILYADLIHTVSKMPNEKAGDLFKHILEYVNDMNPKTDDLIIQLTFEPIKQQLKRDLIKYQGKQKQWSEAGKRSAELRKVNKKERTLTNVKPRSTDLTVTVNDTVNVNVNDNVSVINKRESEFKNSLQPFLVEYGKDMLNEFYLYWTEKKPKGRKMRFEMEKTFDISRRLKRWSNNNFDKKEKSSAKKENAGAIIQRVIQENT